MELSIETIADLLAKRHQAYIKRDRTAAPAIDLVLALYGVEVHDTTSGTTWSYVTPTAQAGA